jgi:hypothetical protein
MADGKPFLLGMENLATSVSTLVRRGGAGPALRVRVDSGPPLAVNSQEKITNLNSDKVDGKDAEAFLAANGKAQDATHADRADTAANADALDGRDSSAFYAVGSKVADSTHADRADWAADAQKLIGRSLNELSGVAQTLIAGDPPLLPARPESLIYGRLTLEIPFPGYLRVNGNVSFFHDESRIIPPNPNVVPGSGMVVGYLRKIVRDGYLGSVASYEDLKGRQYANLALDAVFFVGGGEQTVEIVLARGNEGPGVGPIYAQNGVLTAQFDLIELSG